MVGPGRTFRPSCSFEVRFLFFDDADALGGDAGDEDSFGRSFWLLTEEEVVGDPKDKWWIGSAEDEAATIGLTGIVSGGVVLYIPEGESEPVFLPITGTSFFAGVESTTVVVLDGEAGGITVCCSCIPGRVVVASKSDESED